MPGPVASFSLENLTLVPGNLQRTTCGPFSGVGSRFSGGPAVGSFHPLKLQQTYNLTPHRFKADEHLTTTNISLGLAALQGGLRFLTAQRVR